MKKLLVENALIRAIQYTPPEMMMGWCKCKGANGKIRHMHSTPCSPFFPPRPSSSNQLEYFVNQKVFFGFLCATKVICCTLFPSQVWCGMACVIGVVATILQIISFIRQRCFHFRVIYVHKSVFANAIFDYKRRTKCQKSKRKRRTQV